MEHMDATGTVFRWFVTTFLSLRFSSLLFLALSFPVLFIRRDVNVCHPMPHNSDSQILMSWVTKLSGPTPASCPLSPTTRNPQLLFT
jgi:hypothetical protein